LISINEQVRSMIGIVLGTHGRLAAEFRAALEHVVGPQKQIESIAIGPDDDIEPRRQDIVSAVAKVDSGAGVVVLTDMFGGTPSNLAISIMNGSNIEAIAVNLPRELRACTHTKTGDIGDCLQRDLCAPDPRAILQKKIRRWRQMAWVNSTRIPK
jgi:PTS system mannose-specific IIA component